jgi:hypothetical protein
MFTPRIYLGKLESARFSENRLALRMGGVTERQGRRTPDGGISAWIIIVPHKSDGGGEVSS